MFFKWQFPSSLKRLLKDGPKDGGCDGGSSTAPGWEREGGRKLFFFLPPAYIYFLYFFVCLFCLFALFCLLFFSRGKGDGVSQEQPNLERGEGEKKKRGGVGTINKKNGKKIRSKEERHEMISNHPRLEFKILKGGEKGKK